MRLLLDTNVVMDLLLKRNPWYFEAKEIWRLTTTGRLNPFVSASALTDIFYLCRRQLGAERAFGNLKFCIDGFAICSVSRDDIERAFIVPGADFEDNLQIVIASRERIDAIVTRDPDGFTGSAIPALSPLELLSTLNKIGP
jgi:predicted nucleic acid-binding protein